MLRVLAYQSGDWHDDSGWSDGWDPDIMRYTAYPPFPDQEVAAPDPGFVTWGNPSRRTDLGHHFGSAHPAGFNCVFGDGSVKTIPFTIDPTVFNNLGDRQDGNPLPQF